MMILLGGSWKINGFTRGGGRTDGSINWGGGDLKITLFVFCINVLNKSIICVLSLSQ